MKEILVDIENTYDDFGKVNGYIETKSIILYENEDDGDGFYDTPCLVFCTIDRESTLPEAVMRDDFVVKLKKEDVKEIKKWFEG